MAGRLVDLSRASGKGEREATLFQGERLALRRIEVAPGRRLRVEAAEDEEQVWLPLSGSGRYRPDPMAPSGAAEPFRTGEAAILRTAEWFEVESDGPEPLVLVGVSAPQPPGR